MTDPAAREPGGLPLATALDERTGPFDRTFAAVLCPWDGAVGSAGQDAWRPFATRVRALCASGVDVAVLAAQPLSSLARVLESPQPCHGRLLLCPEAGSEVVEFDVSGMHVRWRAGTAAGADEPDDVLGWLLHDLDARGVGPGLVLAIDSDDDRLSGWRSLLAAAPPRLMVARVGRPATLRGRCAVLRLLDSQLDRHAQRRVPAIDDDPAWTVGIEGDAPYLRRVHETLLTVADGRFGTRGTREEGSPDDEPLVVASGVYTRESGLPRLLPGPQWIRLTIDPVATRSEKRVLDLRSGVLLRLGPHLATARFASLARPGSFALRGEGSVERLDTGPGLVPPEGAIPSSRAAPAERSRVAANGGGIVAAAHTTVTDSGWRRSVERLAAYAAGATSVPDGDAAAEQLEAIQELGFDRLLAEQRATWARRWRHAEIAIDGDPETELAVRFALFHLMASVAGTGEAAVGARGLSGPAYAGHVFWDADVFVLPFLAATHPTSARAMLEYRIARLPAARRLAAAAGCDGARFPWESADDGDDVTPMTDRGPDGSLVRILTGDHEEHVVSAVAWAAWHYSQWSGDRAFLAGRGRGLVLETARYWASRIRVGPEGRGHLYGVIGPDEYHGPVDDNAYTNVLVRWHLARAAELAQRTDRHGVTGEEIGRWRTLAATLADGYDPATSRYEQFAGFYALQPISIADLAPPPVAADVLLGRERIARAQVVKQADVLMLHHLIPEEVAAGSLAANLDYYLPRTAHGSSLSPAIHAGLLARAKRPDAALDLFRVACRLDLDDLSGTTAAGLHLATMGGVWQALTYGFLGARPAGDVFEVDPCLPRSWDAVTVNVRFRTVPLRLTARHDHLEVRAMGTVPLRVAGGAPVPVSGHVEFGLGRDRLRER